MMHNIRHHYRVLMLMGYAIQTITVVAGALLMSSAIEAAQAQRFGNCAFMVAIAFWNAKLFVDTARDQRVFRNRLRELERRVR